MIVSTPRSASHSSNCNFSSAPQRETPAQPPSPPVQEARRQPRPSPGTEHQPLIGWMEQPIRQRLFTFYPATKAREATRENSRIGNALPGVEGEGKLGSFYLRAGVYNTVALECSQKVFLMHKGSLSP